MARIPLGNFGNVIAATAPRFTIPAGAFSGGEGAQKLGDTGIKVAADMMEQQAVEQKRLDAEAKSKQDELDKSQVFKAKVDFEDAVYSAHDQTVEQMQQGTLHRTDAVKTYADLVSKARESTLAGVPQDLRPHAEVLFDATTNRGARGVAKAVDLNGRQEQLGNLEYIRDSMSKQASRPGADLQKINTEFEQVARVLGKEAGLPEDKLGKMTQDFKDGTTYNNYRLQVENAGGSLKSLKDLNARIRGDEGLDSEKRLALISHTQSQIETIKNRQIVEADRRERANAQEWSAAMDVVQAGKSLSPEYATQLQNQFKGTPYGKALNELIQQAPANLAFSAQPVASQERALFNLQAKGNTQGWTPDDKKTYDQYDKTHRATLSDIKADPWKAGLERGVLRDVSPLTFTDISTLPQQIASRRQQSDTLAVWAGRDVSPLRPEEAQGFGRALDAFPATQRADVIGALGNSMSRGQLVALSAQLGERSPTLGNAAFLASRDLRTTAGRTVAEIYLRGVDAVNEKRVSFDEAKQSKVRAEIYQKIAGVYATETATNTAVDVTMGIYAGLKSEGHSGDVSQAVKLATGGIMDYNGGKIAKPWGWSDSKVRDTVKSFTPERVRNLFGEQVLIGGEPMSAAEFAKSLPNARLSASPQDGAYSVIVGRRMVTTLQGKPILLPLEAR